jgi:hypothetical protein
MTQLFAHDDQALAALPLLPVQSPAGRGSDIAPALMAGKGVRAVRCVGCRQETLPRQDDGAPLCGRCCEVLATTTRSFLSLSWWRRRA